MNLAAPCPPIEELSSNSWDELAKAYIKLVFDYSDCAAKHEAVVELWNNGISNRIDRLERAKRVLL